MHDFRRLHIWDEAMEVAEIVYSITEGFPPRENFGLTSQLRSAAVSVSSNIAEGAGRGSDREMARFLRIALGSLAELDSQLELASRLGLVEADLTLRDMIQALGGRIRRLHSQLI